MVVGGVGGYAYDGTGNLVRKAELEKKRKAWAKQVEADKIKAGAVFDSMPWDAAGSLPAAQVPALLAEVMGVGADTVDADGAALVVSHARKTAGVEADALPRAALLESVSKYRSVWKSKFYGAFVLNRRVDLHAIDATPARWRGDAGSSPLDGPSAAASSPRNDLVKNCRVHPTHWLISTQPTTLSP